MSRSSECERVPRVMGLRALRRSLSISAAFTCLFLVSAVILYIPILVYNVRQGLWTETVWYEHALIAFLGLFVSMLIHAYITHRILAQPLQKLLLELEQYVNMIVSQSNHGNAPTCLLDIDDTASIHSSNPGFGHEVGRSRKGWLNKTSDTLPPLWISPLTEILSERGSLNDEKVFDDVRRMSQCDIESTHLTDPGRHHGTGHVQTNIATSDVDLEGPNISSQRNNGFKIGSVHGFLKSVWNSIKTALHTHHPFSRNIPVTSIKPIDTSLVREQIVCNSSNESNVKKSGTIQRRSHVLRELENFEYICNTFETFLHGCGALKSLIVTPKDKSTSPRRGRLHTEWIVHGHSNQERDCTSCTTETFLPMATTMLSSRPHFVDDSIPFQQAIKGAEHASEESTAGLKEKLPTHERLMSSSSDLPEIQISTLEACQENESAHPLSTFMQTIKSNVSHGKLEKKESCTRSQDCSCRPETGQRSDPITSSRSSHHPLPATSPRTREHIPQPDAGPFDRSTNVFQLQSCLQKEEIAESGQDQGRCAQNTSKHAVQSFNAYTHLTHKGSDKCAASPTCISHVPPSHVETLEKDVTKSSHSIFEMFMESRPVRDPLEDPKIDSTLIHDAVVLHIRYTTLLSQMDENSFAANRHSSAFIGLALEYVKAFNEEERKAYFHSVNERNHREREDDVHVGASFRNREEIEDACLLDNVPSVHVLEVRGCSVTIGWINSEQIGDAPGQALRCAMGLRTLFLGSGFEDVTLSVAMGTVIHHQIFSRTSIMFPGVNLASLGLSISRGPRITETPSTAPRCCMNESVLIQPAPTVAEDQDTRLLGSNNNNNNNTTRIPRSDFASCSTMNVVWGEACEQAQRLSELARTIGAQILITEEVYRATVGLNWSVNAYLCPPVDIVSFEFSNLPNYYGVRLDVNPSVECHEDEEEGEILHARSFPYQLSSSNGISADRWNLQGSPPHSGALPAPPTGSLVYELVAPIPLEYENDCHLSEHVLRLQRALEAVRRGFYDVAVRELSQEKWNHYDYQTPHTTRWLRMCSHLAALQRGHPGPSDAAKRSASGTMCHENSVTDSSPLVRVSDPNGTSEMDFHVTHTKISSGFVRLYFPWELFFSDISPPLTHARTETSVTAYKHPILPAERSNDFHMGSRNLEVEVSRSVIHEESSMESTVGPTTMSCHRNTLLDPGRDEKEGKSSAVVSEGASTSDEYSGLSVDPNNLPSRGAISENLRGGTIAFQSHSSLAPYLRLNVLRRMMRNSAESSESVSRMGEEDDAQSIVFDHDEMQQASQRMRLNIGTNRNPVPTTAKLGSRLLVDRHGQRWLRGSKIIGRGASGHIYLGMAEDGSFVALKSLRIPSPPKIPQNPSSTQIAPTSTLYHPDATSAMTSPLFNSPWKSGGQDTMNNYPFLTRKPRSLDDDNVEESDLVPIKTEAKFTTPPSVAHRGSNHDLPSLIPRCASTDLGCGTIVPSSSLLPRSLSLCSQTSNQHHLPCSPHLPLPLPVTIPLCNTSFPVQNNNNTCCLTPTTPPYGLPLAPSRMKGGHNALEETDEERAFCRQNNPEVPIIFPNNVGNTIHSSRFPGLSSYSNMSIRSNSQVTMLSPYSNSIEEFLSEVFLLMQLRHENIVSLRGCAVQGAMLYLVMEYVSGGSLHDLIRDYGPVPLPILKRYMVDILHGLQYLHTNSIIHRDIKPQNILVTICGLCKITDFGTSLRVPNMTYAPNSGEKSRSISPVQVASLHNNNNLTRPPPIPLPGKRDSGAPLKLVGTPNYISPEQCQGKPGTPSDIWSFGVTMCELITGDLPWETQLHGLRLCAIYAHEENKAMWPTPNLVHPNITPEFIEFIAPCFAFNPLERPSAEQLLKKDFLVNF